MRRDRKNPLQILCKSLLGSVPPREPSDKPYLTAWLKEQYRLPPEVCLELAEIVIESLLYEKTCTSQLPQARVPERWQEMMTMRSESLLLRLEAVLARAACKSARTEAVQNRSVALLFRDWGTRRRVQRAA